MTRPRFPRDKNGIPILDEEGVEQVATHFLSVIAPDVLSQPQPCPLTQIAREIGAKGHCTFTFDEDLGCAPDGSEVLGYYEIRERRVAVTSRLSRDDPRFGFTLAHEIGHFYLHSRISPEALKLTKDPRIQDRAQDLRSYRLETTRPRGIMEWQANRFAAGILLPRATFSGAVVREQQDLGIVRRLGRVWLDDQRGSQQDFRNIVSRIAARQKTSEAVVRFRFFDLRLVDQGYRGRGPSRLTTVLGDALQDLFGSDA